jgi:hypothetical protein
MILGPAAGMLASQQRLGKGLASFGLTRQAFATSLAGTATIGCLFAGHRLGGLRYEYDSAVAVRARGECTQLGWDFVMLDVAALSR